MRKTTRLEHEFLIGRRRFYAFNSAKRIYFAIIEIQVETSDFWRYVIFSLDSGAMV
jgi:hypothetical protein